jgi:hypothetical protein
LVRGFVAGGIEYFAIPNTNNSTKQPHKDLQSNQSIPSISPLHQTPRFINQIKNSSQTHINNQQKYSTNPQKNKTKTKTNNF